ncbi:MAG: LacI family DNA-binding transcriptional regulator [Geothrix sp.]|jgi:LacI family transcriptional regulator|uniref:LacI family DNA-binding transcriptional regulator n=1 Tax=Candidatus Geothrix odensensis TaxID=2954440 RepID=A0A936F3C8_9BACT|nr:LacI family DNA-binding transcriptional regulator [Holophagaceae bacterium]MBK8573060.1 LacI family DNA-binding transcriptional regulator [Candidatus Geothrix odensensis]MBK8789433.1 LacI family DNA-binding transcriptional regulator [Holophagaceae bacterium]MBP7616882.1 LacI family DNA-binding transcriptional regulator [Geothrix sp.]MCC6513871.1 LacI family DNA-binding transcriptional regulator [Geothrix sp.]
MKITIGEIARQSGVSTGTVSRVINGKPTVAAETRATVLAVMKKLGYEPDPVARELSRRTKHTLGIWVGAGENRLSPYFNVIWRALLREMQSHATQFVELPVDITPVRRRMDAVLMFHCADIDQRLATLWRRGVPGALIGHHPGVSCVAPDDIGGGRLAAAKLLSLGHRDLLHLTVADEHQWAVDRAAGFTSSLAENIGGSLAPVILRGGGSVLGGYRLMRDAWQRGHRPTGIFCATDEMAVGALGALADLGVAVPTQVSVLGFDGLVDLYPGLASVAQDIPAIAHEAVTLALGAIDREAVRHTIVPVRILDGATLGPAPRRG